MIKLTKLEYKVNNKALERHHNLNENAERLLFDWQKEFDMQENIGGEYPKKPFTEPLDFKDEDFEIRELPFRLPKEAISYYYENEDNKVEIAIYGEAIIAVKENIDFFDNIFGIKE